MNTVERDESTLPSRAYLVTGEDPGLVSQELSALLNELTGLNLFVGAIVEEYSQATKEEPVPIGSILDACRTPPFLTERRLIIVRDGANLDAQQTKEVIAYLKDPLDTTVLVFVVGGRSASATLRKAFESAGRVIDAQPGTNAKSRDQWFVEHLAKAPVRLDGAATELLKSHLGEDIARLEGILGALSATYGPGSTIKLDELEPFLGSEGSVAPWDLTDAIDSGDTSKALHTLSRMLDAKERHPLQIMATLHRHIGAMLRLDGEDTFGAAEAASATGMNAYPAGKALQQSRRLGHEGVTKALTLLANADLDLRGRVGWPDELVMEVLVARLSQLSRQSKGTRSATGSSRHFASQRRG
ncbi:MAG TPA: DNA polymerase III subunit delta [Acidimicrobiales bacterium]|nr:DNA polymerase III subunit delta [Acidimicrobiales bacterium]